MASKKSVHIPPQPTTHTKIFERPNSDTFDVEIIQDVILYSLHSTVREAFQNIQGKDSPTNPDIRQHISNTLQTVLHPHPMSNHSLEAVTTYLFKHMDQPTASVFHDAITLRDPVAHHSALILMHTGLLNVYFTIHCKNKCDPDSIGTKRKRSKTAIQDACDQMHTAIKTTIGTENIRAFDRLLRIASNTRCSIFRL